MHIEPPEHLPRTIKEFFGQYLMIVLGILTALGLEQVLETVHHHHLAHQATEQIEEELKSNLAGLKDTLAQNRKRLAVLKSAQAGILAEALQKTPDAEKIAALFNAISVGAMTPGLRRDAWDAAIASQAVSYVDAAAVRRYSEGYSAQREAGQTILATVTLGNWPDQLTSSMVDQKLGRSDPANLLKALAAFDMSLTAIIENERELEEALTSSLREPAGPTSH